MVAVYSWIKDIVCYLILISLVFQILPNENYRKYMKLFSGIVLVIIVLKPFGVFMKEESLENIMKSINQYDANEEDFNAQIEEFQKKQEIISEQYVGEQLKEQIQQIVEDKGYYVQQAEVGEQDGKELLRINLIEGNSKRTDIVIEAIEIQNQSESEESDEIQEIKKEIASYYQIEDSAILIQLGGQMSE